MANYIIGAVIVVLVALALRRVIRQAKTGKPACCGDCGGCGCGKTDEKRITTESEILIHQRKGGRNAALFA